MKVDMTVVLKDIDGETDLFETRQEDPNDPSSIERVPLTLRQVCLSVLLAGEQQMNFSLAQKIDNFCLASAIQASDEVELDTAQINTIIERVAKSWASVVVGRVCEILDPVRLNKDSPEKKE